MKIAINLVGISHLDDEKINSIDGNGRQGHKRNYDDCEPNLLNNLIYPLNKLYDVDVYITTYNHSHIDDLIKMYNPVETNIIEDFGSSTMQKTYISSLQKLQNKNIDFVISTRFDLVMLKPINEINFNIDKFNVPYRESGYTNLTTDLMFLFNIRYLNSFIDSIQKMINIDSRSNGLHPVVYLMQKDIGAENINIIDEEDQVGFCGQNKYFCVPRLLNR